MRHAPPRTHATGAGKGRPHQGDLLLLFWARIFLNRVWKQRLGRGLVEPEDDLRPTNPTTHPAQLDELDSEFYLRRLVGAV